MLQNRSGGPYTCIYGEHCSQDFLAFPDQLAINEDEFERPAIVMFHKLQGYDSMFIQKELYNQHHLVENQVCVGIKVNHDWCYHLQGLFLFSTFFISFIS